jgi:cysteine desulfurase
MTLVMSLPRLASTVFDGRMATMIYLDHSATTAVEPRVVDVMTPYWSELYGNPSSMYGLGRKAAAALEGARARVATLLNCQPGEIVFTSGGTESDNLALRGVGMAQAARGRKHIITTPIEHHAVLHTVAGLAEHFDFDVTYLPLDRHGLVDPDAVAASIRSDTALISVMAANNEVGTVEPIAEIGAIARQNGIRFTLTLSGRWLSAIGCGFSQRGLVGSLGAQILWTQGCGAVVHSARRQARASANGR